MCELFGASAAGAQGLAEWLNPFRTRGGGTADNPDGWGVASWRAGDLRIEKAPEPGATSGHLAALARTLEARVLIAHVRKARHPPVPGMLNTHPFVHACCGREWVFAHNGLVPELIEHEPEAVVCRPAGETDSEHAFCHLLGAIAACYQGGPECDWLGRLGQQAGSIAALGKFNFLLSDGDVLVAYGHDRLHHCECDRLALVATEPLTQEAWVPFARGELRVYKAGELLLQLVAVPPRPAAAAA
ncbi:MAG TPA: class II glutamine amidotransferase [Burkholderiales bacterium]|nr:class II glutamine amidotransferase [Burkholderiales bacterium]